NSSFSSAYATFSADVPDAELHELPGTCAHFVVDRDGTIYQLVRLNVICRHTVGLNWAAIGIEHVGLSDAQVLGDPAQMRSPLALVSAMGLLWQVGFHWVDAALFAGLYVGCAFGTTIGFHRFFTHKGFEAGAPIKALLAILGCMTMQGPVTQWVTDHRKHHALSDKPGDPHSPHVGHGSGAWGALKGFVHAHV